MEVTSEDERKVNTCVSAKWENKPRELWVVGSCGKVNKKESKENEWMDDSEGGKTCLQEHASRHHRCWDGAFRSMSIIKRLHTTLCEGNKWHLALSFYSIIMIMLKHDTWWPLITCHWCGITVNGHKITSMYYDRNVSPSDACFFFVFCSVRFASASFFLLRLARIKWRKKENHNGWWV